MYVNVGAKVMPGNSDIPSKKALKACIAANPGDVVLYDTSELSTPGTRTCSYLDVGVKYTVVGPNPYTSRKWYATVEKLPNGTIRVS